MFTTPFESEKKASSRNSITFEESDVVFVADMFMDEYTGGAELTTGALANNATYKTFQLKCDELSDELLMKGAQKIWVFFNFSRIDFNMLPKIVANCRYFIVEYDYKFCRYRSIDIHKMNEDKECDCHQQQWGKLVSAFFTGAEHIFWMSEGQRNIYHERFSFLKERPQTILSSIFEVKDLEHIEKLHNARQSNGHNDKFVVINSSSPIKGVEQTKNHLDQQNIEYDIVGGLNYSDLLRTLSEYKGLAFMPLGGDTCPRLVIEAKLMGLELMLNENVQHQTESWWQQERDEIEDYLLQGFNRFWDTINDFVNRDIKLSGYTQAYNVMNSDYPWRESITSLLGFCDEVVVLDGGSDDGTYEELQKWAAEDTRLVVRQLKRDWNDKRFALFNGQQKAAARTLCTGEWCWQVDIDEVIHEDDYNKVKKLIRQLPKTTKLVSLPVIEYWGGSEKVRVDINPWKWRLSKNDPHITHGVNAQHRRYDEEGNLFSIGSDGDDYIHTDSYQIIPDMNFYTPQLHQVRMAAMEGNEDALKAYRNFINLAAEQLPGVHHYSWFDLKRKVYSYKNFWSRHWASLYNKVIDDVPENNMFFDKKWEDVTDQEIEDISVRMKEEMGGWIFHSRIDFDKPTPWIDVEKGHPSIMKEWIEKREGSK